MAELIVALSLGLLALVATLVLMWVCSWRGPHEGVRGGAWQMDLDPGDTDPVQ